MSKDYTGCKTKKLYFNIRANLSRMSEEERKIYWDNYKKLVEPYRRDAIEGVKFDCSDDIS